jgi:RsmE family RNA methyltransferase
LIAGPEGGFSSQEMEHFEELSKSHRIVFASMGYTNLRSETATMLALGIVKNFIISLEEAIKS